MILERVMLDDLLLMDCADEAYPIGLTGANLGSGPEPRASSEGKPSADGTINRTRYWGARMVELVGYAGSQASTLEEATALLDTLRAAFTLREAHVLRFTPLGQAEREMQVVVASRFDAPVEGRPPVLSWAIVLEAPDPRMYGAEVVSVSYEPGTGAEVSHGLDFPLTWPLDFSHASTPGGAESLSAWNGGSISTPVLLTLAGPVTSLTGIVNRTTGERLAFGLIGIAEGSVLEADTGARTLTLDGAPRPEMIDAAQNTWFELVPGENVLAIEGAGFLPGITRLTATYREAMI